MPSDERHRHDQDQDRFTVECRFELYAPDDAADLTIAMLSIQIAARACAIHDEGATVLTVVSHPDRHPGIGYLGESDYDSDAHGRNSMRDPIMIAAARHYIGELTLTWDEGVDWADEALPDEALPEHPESSRYVRDQWPRITDLAYQLLRHGGALRYPHIMPPLPAPGDPQDGSQRFTG